MYMMCTTLVNINTCKHMIATSTHRRLSGSTDLYFAEECHLCPQSILHQAIKVGGYIFLI